MKIETISLTAALAVWFLPASADPGDPPVIVSQPQSQTIQLSNCSYVTFTVSASGAAPLAYQWQFNGVNISGATASTCTCAPLTNAGNYDVVVTNSWGATTSQVATLDLVGWDTVPGWGLYGWIDWSYVPTPELGLARQADSATLSWPSAYSDGVLFTTTNLTPPVTWSSQTIQSNQTSTAGGLRLFTTPATDAQRFFQFYHSQLIGTIPVFEFAIFYNSLLEFNWCAPMSVNGRTHANGSIYTGTMCPLIFNGLVTATGTISSPAWDGLAVSNYTVAATFNAGYSTNCQALALPIGTTNLHAIIEMPPNGEDPNSALGQQRYYNKASLVLLVSNSTVTLSLKSAPSDPQTITRTAYYFPTNTSPTNYTQITTNFPFLNVTNTFTDQRENDTVKVTDINVGILDKWLVTNTAALAKFPSTAGVYPTSNVPNILYVADNRTCSAYQLTALRLRNGTTIPTNMVTIVGNNQPSGFTVATPNPLYVQGVYNAPVVAEQGTTNTTHAYPASLVSDALTILSGAWADSASNQTMGQSGGGVRTATSTTVNAAILTGIVPSTGSGATQFSGGVQNLPRLLEDWGNGGAVRLTLNTSMVNLFASAWATNQWYVPGAYYYAPTRQFSFNQNFLDYTNLPPGTPLLALP